MILSVYKQGDLHKIKKEILNFLLLSTYLNDGKVLNRKIEYLFFYNNNH